MEEHRLPVDRAGARSATTVAALRAARVLGTALR